MTENLQNKGIHAIIKLPHYVRVSHNVGQDALIERLVLSCGKAASPMTFIHSEFKGSADIPGG